MTINTTFLEKNITKIQIKCQTQVQDFLGNEVMESDNIQCQIETNDAFKDMDMRIFLEELLFSVELKSVVKALHNVVEGDDITSIDIEKITTAEVDPSMYETQAFLSFLERTSEGDINNYNSELSALKSLWSNCQENPQTSLSREDQLIKDVFMFWRDHMISVNHINNCQEEVRAYVFNNDELSLYIESYINPLQTGTQQNADQVILEFNDIKEIQDNCTVDEGLELTDPQREAEQLIREMFAFWIDKMIPLNNNVCQQGVVDYIAGNDELILFINDLFNVALDPLNTIYDDISEPESPFRDRMRGHLDELESNWDMCING